MTILELTKEEFMIVRLAVAKMLAQPTHGPQLEYDPLALNSLIQKFAVELKQRAKFEADVMQDCVLRGRNARRADIPLEACPNFRVSEMADAWCRGWRCEDAAIYQIEVRGKSAIRAMCPAREHCAYPKCTCPVWKWQ